MKKFLLHHFRTLALLLNSTRSICCNIGNIVLDSAEYMERFLSWFVLKTFNGRKNMGIAKISTGWAVLPLFEQ